MSLRVILVLLAVLPLAPVSAATLDITFIKASTTALEDPHGLKLSPGGKYLVVADVGNNCIVALDPHTRGLIAGFGSDHQCGIPDMDFDVAAKAESPSIESSRAATGVRPDRPWSKRVNRGGVDFRSAT
jgi:DNA-binding beta-propeller fold protein YncE